MCVSLYYLSLIPTATFAPLQQRNEENVHQVTVKEEVRSAQRTSGGKYVITFTPFPPLIPFLPVVPWRKESPTCRIDKGKHKLS